MEIDDGNSICSLLMKTNNKVKDKTSLDQYVAVSCWCEEASNAYPLLWADDTAAFGRGGGRPAGRHGDWL